jgi:hypothetical protein
MAEIKEREISASVANEIDGKSWRSMRAQKSFSLNFIRQSFGVGIFFSREESRKNEKI